MTPYYTDGQATIYHADAFDILPRLEGVGALVTDPPYSSGGAFRGDRMTTALSKYASSDSSAQRGIGFTGDNRDQRAFLAWCSLWLTACRGASVEGATFAIFTDWRQLPTLTDAVQVAGYVWRGVGAWSKKFGRPRAGGFSGACEFLAWGSHGALDAVPTYPAGVFECSAPPVRTRAHLTEKPEPVMAWALGNVAPGRLVLDPFMGSGSTLIAARLRGCSAVGVEIDERYCEIVARRLSQELPFDPPTMPSPGLWGRGAL